MGIGLAKKIIHIIYIALLILCVTLYEHDIDKLTSELESVTHKLNTREQEIEVLCDEINDLVNDNMKLEMELKKNNSTPRELLKIACKEYNVDYILAVSIARVETGNFTSELFLKYNNLGGLSNDYGWYKYNTLIEGINAYVSMLKLEYIDKGLDTPEKMQPKYCPGKDGQHWISLVCQIMEEEKK